MVGKTKIQQSSLCAFTTDRSKMQRLDTDIANMMAESINYWLIKFVLLILCKSKFTVSPNKGSNCEGKILAYKKNKLCLISILYIKNIKEECFTGYKPRARDVLSMF